MSQESLLKEYYLANPNVDVPHADIVDWVTAEWKKRTGKVFRDPDRGIRKLYQSGFLQKVSKGVYRYDPDLVANPDLEDFTEAQKREILKRGGNKCAVCGKSRADGVELQIDHIKPKDKGGKATIANGQILCAQHNFKKKNYNQTETAKRLFVNLQEQAKELGDSELEEFAKDVLRTYDKHGVNGHIDWKDE